MKYAFNIGRNNENMILIQYAIYKPGEWHSVKTQCHCIDTQHYSIADEYDRSKINAHNMLLHTL